MDDEDYLNLIQYHVFKTVPEHLHGKAREHLKAKAKTHPLHFLEANSTSCPSYLIKKKRKSETYLIVPKRSNMLEILREYYLSVLFH